MGLDERLGNRQTKAGPGSSAVLTEHLEDPFSFFEGNAGTLICDRNLDQRHWGLLEDTGD